tara:strand:- start:212 stop:892 length:681 start_codon:yes stop_codon:yes gene_type:complete
MIDKMENSDDDLAAEYALGVLDGVERDRVQKRIDNDVNFARLVASWEERLSPLSDGIEEVEAPAHIKANIDGALFVEDITSKNSIGMLGIMTRFRIPILLAVLVFALTPRVMDYFQSGSNNAQVLYTASIDSLETYNVAFFAEVTDQGVIVTQSEGVKPLDKDFELWLVRSDGQVLTLGVLSAPLNPEGLDIPADSKFAISVEPIGGSPTGVATGPVVALGALTSV